MAANEYKINAAGGLVVPRLASDPSSPSDGALWYNTTSGQVKQRQSGSTSTLSFTAGNGIDATQLTSGVIQIQLDGSTLSLSASGIKVATGGITNNEVNASAAIDYSKLATLTTSRALQSDGSGYVSASSVTSTELGYVSGVTSAIQTQLDAKATTSYVDNLVNGLKWKQQVRAASFTDVDLTNDLEDGDTFQALTLATGDRILLAGQTTDSENGIYVVQASGAAVRAADADTFTELVSASAFVEEGTFADKGYHQTAEITDFTGQTWVQNFGTGLYVADETTLTLSSQTFSVKNGGISNTQINASAAIQFSKMEALTANRATATDASGFMVASSVTDTELGYVSGVTSAIQTQLDGKLNLSGGTMTGDLTLGDNRLLHGNNGLRMANSSTPTSYFETEYEHTVTLTASQTSAVASAFTFAHGTYEAVQIEYKIKEATTNALRTGTLYIVSNGTDTSMTDSNTETADVGVTWDLNINGANTEVRYTTTANNKTMRAIIKRILA